MAVRRFFGSLLGALVLTVILAVIGTGVLVVDLVERWRPAPGADVFDPHTGTWSLVDEPSAPSSGVEFQPPPPPAEDQEIYAIRNGLAIAVPRMPYVELAEPSTRTIHVYEDGRWEPLGSLEQLLDFPAFARLADDRVMLVDEQQALLIDPGRRSLTPLPAPPASRWGGSVIGAGDRVYTAVDDFDAIQMAVLVVDQGEWSTVPSSPSPRIGAEIRGTSDGRVMLVGGDIEDPSIALAGLIWVLAFVFVLGLAVYFVVRGARHGSLHWVGAIVGVVLGGVVTMGGLFLLIVTSGGFAHGRPLRIGRRVHRGRVRAGPRCRATLGGPRGPTRWILAQQWARDAALEHASVAAFERLGAQLRALGAPAPLRARAHEAAEQEAEHARLCLELASRYAGRELRLVELPSVLEERVDDREDALARLAVESLIDGVVGEGWAAAAATRALEEADDPQARHALRVIARDEASHARLGRDVVSWCLHVGGARTHRAVRRAILRQRRRRPPRGLPMSRWTDELARHGRLRRRPTPPSHGSPPVGADVSRRR